MNRTLKFLSLLLAWMFSSIALSQETDTTVVGKSDTSLSPAPISAQPIIPIQHVGTIDRKYLPSQIISDSAASFNDYNYLNDIITARGGEYVRDLGSPGQYSELTVRGLGGRHTAFLRDGILLNEPLTGTYNPFWMQTEQIERVEIETGTRSFLYGLNSTGGAINVTTKHYKAIRPLTRIRYSESRYEQTFFDGMFSQNITRNFNLTGGVQRYVTDGRYSNSDFDMWGARIRARYDASSRWNFFFSEHYTQTQLGLFGGIDYPKTSSADRFDPLRTTILSGDMYEKITRHDLRLGSAAQLFDDSTSITVLTTYFSTHTRELRDENNRPNADSFYVFDDHHLHWQGVKLTQHVEGTSYALNLGGEVQFRQIIESPATGYRSALAANAFGKIELEPIEHFRFAGYARLDRYLNRTPISVGSDVALMPAEWLRIQAGYSRSVRFPTFQESFWRGRNISGPTAEFKPEQHQLAEIGFQVHLQDFQLRTTLFRRVVHDYIATFFADPLEPFPGVEFAVVEKTTLSGIDVAAQLRIWSIFAEGSAHYLNAQESDAALPTMHPGNTRPKRFPDWWASGGIYFWDRVFDDNLNLKIGVRGRLYGRQQGTEFNPEAMMFVPSSLPRLGIAMVTDGVLVAYIGRAYIHFIWQNLFDNDYALTPFYPMPDRAVRFGISWELLD